MNYLREKIENLNGEISILEDNLNVLEHQPENHERLKQVTRKMIYIAKHLNLDLENFEE